MNETCQVYMQKETHSLLTMDKSDLKKTGHGGAVITNKHDKSRKKVEKQASEDPRLLAIREFGERLQIRAEKVRLLTRTDEGHCDGDFNPYETMTLPVQTIQQIVKTEADPESVAKEPLTVARQRRRNKQQGSHGHQRTTVNIKDYRPGYTWNKGGRMKELRIRTVARKFLQLWKLQVFGRVTPSVARAHYNRRLLKITFRTWHSIWWELRKEWRLVIRAECHHRYVLWRKTFRAWQNFVVKERVKNSKKALAGQHSSIKALRKCLDGWKMYIQGRREKRRKTSLALDHHNQCLTRNCWERWMTRQETRLHRQNMESIALQFWAYRIQAQHWLIWQRRMSQIRKASWNNQRAVRHHNTVIVQRCFQALMAYRDLRLRKKQEKDYAIMLYERVLTGQMFGRWMEAYSFRRALNERHEVMTELANTFQKRRMFLHWRHYIKLENEKLTLIAEAEDHYQRKLLAAGLSAFRLSVVQKKIKLMRQTMADQLRYKQLLRWAFSTWLSRCDNNDELRMIGQSQLARQHYRKVLLVQCFQQLQDYTAWRQHRQRQYAKADAHYYMQAMPEYMFRWKHFVNMMKTNRVNTEHCYEFRRENLLARFFYLWVNQYEFSKEYRMNERMAILHHDSISKRYFFKCWKLKTAEAQREAMYEEMADEHNDNCVLRRHYLAWTSYIQELKNSQRQAVEAAQYDRRKKLRKMWQAWKLYTIGRREKKRKTERAYQHYKRKVCGRMITMWLHYVDTQRLIRERAEVMHLRNCAQRVRELFYRWRENVQEQMVEKQLVEKAVSHHNHHIMGQVFTAWHRFAAIHAYKKSETRQWVQTAREQLDIKLLRLLFTKWVGKYKDSMTGRVKISMATSYHDNKMKQKVMVAWQQFTKESIRKSLLQKQSDWFQNVSLTARYFVSWKQALDERQTENERTSLALWHWSLTLNRKVLIGWFTYVQQRKQKKARISDAMERRRCRLLRDGLTQWLNVADSMSAMRKRFAAQQQAKGAHQTYQLVLRCGLHWKHWALGRSEGRASSKPKSVPEQFAITMSVPSTSRGDNLTHVTPRSITTSYVEQQTQSQQVTPRSTVEPAHVPVKQPAHITRSHIPQPKPDIFQPSVRSQSRARPRRPDFLVESLKKAGLYSITGLNMENSTAPVEPVPLPQQVLHNGDHGLYSETTKVERLNLSAMSSARTDCSVPFQHYGGSVSDRCQTSSRPQPVETDVSTAQNVTGAKTEMETIVTAQNDTQTGFQFGKENTVDDNSRQGSARQPEYSLSNMPGQTQQQFPEANMPQSVVNQTSIKPLLLTPADFIQSKKADTDLYINLRHVVDENLTPRTLQELNIHSECQSVVSTPRVLCQNTDHGHPLYETFSFKPGEYKGEITPRSTVTTPRDDQNKLTSLGFQSSQASTKEVHREIVVIRNRLKSFDQRKKKLRTMQKQLRQLRDWLKMTEATDEHVEDDDVNNAQLEVQELTADIECLQKSVEGEKMKCAGLVDRVKVLMSQLNTVT